MLPLTTEEIEQTIIEMRKEGQTIREISKVVHKNFTYIGEVIRKHFGNAQPKENERSDLKQPSGETMALKLFKKDYEPVEVAIKLNLPLEEVNAMYSRYCHSKGLGEFLQVYEKMKPCLQSVFDLSKIMEKHHMSTRKMLKVIKSVIDNPLIDFDYSIHNKQVMEAKEELHILNLKITQREDYLNSMNGYQYYRPWQLPPNPWFLPPNW